MKNALTNVGSSDIIKPSKRDTENKISKGYLSKRTLIEISVRCSIRLKIKAAGGKSHGQYSFGLSSICQWYGKCKFL